MIIKSILKFITQDIKCVLEYSLHSKNRYSKKPIKINNINIVKEYIDYLSIDLDDIIEVICDKKEYFMIYRDENDTNTYVIFLDGTKGYWILKTSKYKLFSLLSKEKCIFLNISTNPQKYNFIIYKDKGI